MAQIGQRIQSFTGKPVVGNSYEGGARYWGVPTNIVNGYGISAFESEHFLNADHNQWTQLGVLDPERQHDDRRPGSRKGR